LAKKKLDNQTENAILKAADKIFTKRGFAAARMEDIAKEAGINRALLHYYFRSKARLFELVFTGRFREFFSGLSRIITSEKSLREKIEELVVHDITLIRQHPDLPMFVMQELSRNPDRLIAHAQQSGTHSGLINTFRAQVSEEVRKGNIREIEGGQLLINIMSMAIYPFIARPMIKAMHQFGDLGFDQMIEVRKKELPEFIMNALKP